MRPYKIELIKKRYDEFDKNPSEPDEDLVEDIRDILKEDGLE